MGHFLVSLSLFLFIAPSWGQDFSAELFDLTGKTKLMSFAGSRTYDKGVMTYKGEYKNLDNSIAVKESATINNGVIGVFEIQSLQTKEKGKVYTKSGKIYFEYTNEKRKKSKAWSKLQPDTVVSASLIPFLQKNFGKILAKKDLNFKFAVWYRKEVINFRFVFHEEKAGNVVVKMYPTNLLYRSLVNPLYYTLNKKTKALVASKGRTVPKKKVGRKWKPLDVSSTYK